MRQIWKKRKQTVTKLTQTTMTTHFFKYIKYIKITSRGTHWTNKTKKTLLFSKHNSFQVVLHYICIFVLFYAISLFACYICCSFVTLRCLTAGCKKSTPLKAMVVGQEHGCRAGACLLGSS